MLEALISRFAQIEDPRCDWRVEHKLVDVLVIAVCGDRRGRELRGHRPLRPLQAGLAATLPRAAGRHPLPRHLNLRRMHLAGLLTLPSLTTPCALIGLISCVGPGGSARANARDQAPHG